MIILNAIFYQEWLLNRMEEDGFILEIVPHNQIEENIEQAKDIESGILKKITYTATIFDSEIEDMIEARSFDTFFEALKWSVMWYEENHSN